MPPPPIRLVEVGPRDGLQNEPNPVPLAAKVALIDRLSETGLNEIEAGAFVRADRVPQMADSERVFKTISRKPGVVYSALVPNEAGLERACEAEVDKIAVFTAASETFNQKNINASIAESIERFGPVVAKANELGLPARGYVSTAFWCPFEGRIAPAKVVETCARLMNLGLQELSIGDTIGKASPDEVRALIPLLLKSFRPGQIYLHFHDTYGRAVENALTAWKEFGISGFDSSAGGLGGCPYAPGASGNVATEDLLQAFKDAGAEIPADPMAIARAASPLSGPLGHPLRSKLANERNTP